MSVRISGIGEAQAAPGESLETLIYRGSTAALAEAGLGRDELDGVVLAASDQVDGRAISSMLTSGPAGAYLNEEINVASSPGHALAVACMQIMSGDFRRLLVSSWGKGSESASGSIQAAERLSAEPFYERDGGSSSLAAAAMQAQLRRASAADPRRAAAAAAEVAARNHGPSVSADDVAASRVVAQPLRELECPPEIDASYSLLIEAGDRDLDAPAVTVDGFGWRSESGRLPDRDLLALPGLRAAAADAFARAGIADAAAEVGAWELHDYTPDAELLAYPALGLCGDGDADALAFEALARVNAAGGSVRGEAPFGGPLRKLLQAVRQLRGSAGDAQLPAVDRAVAQIASGFAGQFQSVFVLGRESR